MTNHYGTSVIMAFSLPTVSINYSKAIITILQLSSAGYGNYTDQTKSNISYGYACTIEFLVVNTSSK